MTTKMCTVEIICGISRSKIRNYMHSIALDHMGDCGEINLTALAEDAADKFDLYDEDNSFAIPEEVFELSFDVAEMFN